MHTALTFDDAHLSPEFQELALQLAQGSWLFVEAAVEGEKLCNQFHGTSFSLPTIHALPLPQSTKAMAAFFPPSRHALRHKLSCRLMQAPQVDGIPRFPWVIQGFSCSYCFSS